MKYIIDLNPDCVEGEYLRIPARIAGEEQWLVTKATLTPYTEPDIEQIRGEAWEAVRKIVALSTVDRREVFGSEHMYIILNKHTASEAIEKLKAYEQEQNEIQVGDEVTMDFGKAVVTGVGPVYFEYVYADGSGHDEVENVKKTGRHFPEIAEVLRKMKEGE